VDASPAEVNPTDDPQAPSQEQQDGIGNKAAQPPIDSLAELYPDSEPTTVSAAEIETAPVEVSAASDPEVAVAEAAQTSEQVPVAEIETEAATELTEEHHLLTQKCRHLKNSRHKNKCLHLR
jgi:hypothetical protein